MSMRARPPPPAMAARRSGCLLGDLGNLDSQTWSKVNFVGCHRVCTGVDARHRWHWLLVDQGLGFL